MTFLLIYIFYVHFICFVVSLVNILTIEQTFLFCLNSVRLFLSNKVMKKRIIHIFFLNYEVAKTQRGEGRGDFPTKSRYGHKMGLF